MTPPNSVRPINEQTLEAKLEVPGNSHAKRLQSIEGKGSMNKQKKLMTFLIIIAFGLAIFIYRFFQIDSCLDRGGAWNHEKGFCDQ